MQRAFDLLAELGTGSTPPTLSELARATQLPVSTVSRLLSTLEQAGFVERAPSGGYVAGLRVVQIGLSTLRGLDIYDLAEPYLHRLAEATGETANLAVRADPERLIYLRQSLSPQSIHYSSWLGRVLPLNRTAVGAALLGEINEQGYVARRKTIEPDVTAIAAPIRGPGGDIVAAFSITGPTYRIGDADVERFGALIAEEARRTSAELGGALAPRRER